MFYMCSIKQHSALKNITILSKPLSISKYYGDLHCLLPHILLLFHKRDIFKERNIGL